MDLVFGASTRIVISCVTSVLRHVLGGFVCKIYLYFPSSSKPRPIDPKEQNNKIWKIGRLPTSDIKFTHPETSREHALLRTDDGQWEIFALETPNGTRLNGARLPSRQWVILNESDHLEFGNKSSRFTVSFIRDDTLSGQDQSEPTTALKVDDHDDDDDGMSTLTYAGAVVRLIERAPTWRLVLVTVAFLIGLAIVLIVR